MRTTINQTKIKIIISNFYLKKKCFPLPQPWFLIHGIPPFLFSILFRSKNSNRKKNKTKQNKKTIKKVKNKPFFFYFTLLRTGNTLRENMVVSWTDERNSYSFFL